MNIAFRISVPYTEIGLTLLGLFDLTEQVAVYEHEADEKVSRTHIHGLLMSCSRKEDTIRNNYFKKHFPGKYQLATTWKNDEGKIVPVDDGYVTYMSKGVLDPKYVKGYSAIRIAELKAKWIDYSQEVEPAVDTATPKKKESQCIFDILQRVRELCHKESHLTNRGDLVAEVCPTRDNFWILCNQLNKSRIRTSRNELERAWVTLLRMDEGNCDSIFSAIQKNVFR